MLQLQAYLAFLSLSDFLLGFGASAAPGASCMQNYTRYLVTSLLYLETRRASNPKRSVALGFRALGLLGARSNHSVLAVRVFAFPCRVLHPSYFSRRLLFDAT